MTAIYGQLFELGTGGKIVPDLATGYSFSPDGKTLTINLRKGVTFTDGTPFNAQAVYTNWMRDLGTIGIKNGFSSPWPIAELPAPKGSPPGTPMPPAAGVVQVTDPYTIVLHFTAPDGAAIDQLFDNIETWIASPTALSKKGDAAFGQNPVGAGPFQVVSNVPNNQLIVKKNPSYWQAGSPLPRPDHVQDGRQRPGGVRGDAGQRGPGLREPGNQPAASPSRRSTSRWRTTSAPHRTTCS